MPPVRVHERRVCAPSCEKHGREGKKCIFEILYGNSVFTREFISKFIYTDLRKYLKSDSNKRGTVSFRLSREGRKGSWNETKRKERVGTAERRKQNKSNNIGRV